MQLQNHSLVLILLILKQLIAIFMIANSVFYIKKPLLWIKVKLIRLKYNVNNGQVNISAFFGLRLKRYKS